MCCILGTVVLFVHREGECCAAGCGRCHLCCSSGAAAEGRWRRMHHPTATRRQIARYDQLLAELDRAIADGDARAAGWVTTASALERTSYSTPRPTSRCRTPEA